MKKDFADVVAKGPCSARGWCSRLVNAFNQVTADPLAPLHPRSPFGIRLLNAAPPERGGGSPFSAPIFRTRRGAALTDGADERAG